MSNITAFPDAIVFPDGTIRLITFAAKEAAFAATEVRNTQFARSAKEVPDYVPFHDDVPPVLERAGLVLVWERVPVGHYRSNLRKWPNRASASDEVVVYFLARVPEEYRQSAASRAYARHRRRKHNKQTATRGKAGETT